MNTRRRPRSFWIHDVNHRREVYDKFYGFVNASLKTSMSSVGKFAVRVPHLTMPCGSIIWQNATESSLISATVPLLQCTASCGMQTASLNQCVQLQHHRTVPDDIVRSIVRCHVQCEHPLTPTGPAATRR